MPSETRSWRITHNTHIASTGSARRAVTAGVAATLLVASAGMAVSQQPREPLPPEACRMIARDAAELAATGIQAIFDNGPDWAKENATPAQVEGVAKLIALREQLRFSCPVGFDNLVVAAIRGEDGGGPPPLPVRLPQERRAERTELAAQARATRSRGVPLPVRKPRLSR